MSRLTTSWDAVVTSAPLNKDAAIARDGSGDHWEPQKLATTHSELPIPIKPFPKTALDLPDLRGKTIGRLTVLGLRDRGEGQRSDKSPAGWVVRCVCGRYETRRTKALRTPHPQGDDRCSACWKLEDLKTLHQRPEPTTSLLARRA